MGIARFYERTRGQAASRTLFLITLAFLFGLSLPFSTTLVEKLKDKKIVNDNVPGYLIPAAIALISVIFSYDNVTKVIEEAIDSDVSIKIAEIQEEYNRKAPEAIKERQELEFLAIWINEEQINNIDFNEMSLTLRQELMRDRDDFTNKTIKDFRDRFYARREIIEQLDGEEGKKKLQSIVREAVDYTLGKSRYDKISLSENNKYINVEAVLRAWLLCSIKYDMPMPIKSLKKIINNSKYEIEALKYIKSTMLDKPKLMKILTTTLSREIVKEYIGKFIQLISG